MLDIGRRIRELRKERGLSGKELSGMLDFSQGFLSHLECNQKTPSLETLDAICLAFGITLGEFFTEDKPALPLDLHRLIQAAERLTPMEREYLTKFIQARQTG